ncbi:NADH-quinone oxidoreductase subunit J [Buchananella hordeovulneris]|nr:NADH-quinone oxidoreductase subunit J [Buchananella hordeovulneris]RRD43771.1 NADH-quinone oxidoreductase subunit J [Buchananella hordeovulneris]
MNLLTHPMSLTVDGTLSGGETVLFAVAAPLIVIAALGVLLAKKPVHAAVAMIFVMVPLAFLYIAQEAPFVGAVQVVVYTGAVMMLFLFVIMLVGVGQTETWRERLRFQLPLTVLAALGTLGLLLAFIVRATKDLKPIGLTEANADTNPVALAHVLFGNHVAAMELTGTLLIVAAVGAMTLTHKHRHGPKQDLAATAAAKMRAYQERGVHLGQKPAPGVYARTNAATAPALAGTGEVVEESVPQVLRVRGQGQALAEVAPDVVAALAAGQPLHGPAANQRVGQSGALGMPGTSPAPALPLDALPPASPQATAPAEQEEH